MILGPVNVIRCLSVVISLLDNLLEGRCCLSVPSCAAKVMNSRVVSTMPARSLPLIATLVSKVLLVSCGLFISPFLCIIQHPQAIHETDRDLGSDAKTASPMPVLVGALSSGDALAAAAQFAC